MERKSLTLIVPLVLFAMFSLASADPSFGSIQTRRVPNSAQLIRRDGSCTGTYCDFGGLCVGGTCDCSTSIGYDGIGCDTPSSCINNPCENNGACQTFASPTLPPYQDSSLDYTRSSLNTYSVGCNTGDQDLLYSYEQLLVRFYSTICTNGKAPSVSGVGFYVKSALINTTDLQAVADLLITVSITAATGPADYATGAVLASVEIPYSDLVATFDSVAGENGFFHVAKFDTLVDIPCSTAIAVSLHNSDMSSIKGFFQVGALQEQLHPDIQPAYGLAASCAVNSLTSLDNIFGSNYPTPALSVVFDPLSLVQCVCPAGTTGALCDVDLSDNCLPNPCENGGTCTNENFDYSCTCPVGFGGKSCELTQGIDSCFSFPCTNGGSCSNVRDTSGQKVLALESFSNAVVTSVQNTRFIGWNFNIDQLVSVIEVGFTLPGAFAPKVVIIFDPTLKIWAYGDITSVASLDNGFFYTASVYGPGLLQPGQYYLQLDLGVAGDGEVYTTTAAMNWNKDITIVNSVQCETGPFCTTVSNLDFIAPQFRFIFGNVFTFHCDCPAGFTGPTCETDINECSSSPCVNSGTCSEGFMSDYFECICPIGFTGLVCETNINDCASSPCSNGATCLDGISSYVCFCAQGYSGSRCESEFDACDSSPCSNGGICSQGALPNTVVCFCPPGFTGDNCGTALSNNGCESSPCSNGGVCITGTFSYSCSCLTGYTGVNCETNLNATPCDSNPCLGGGTCVASPTAFICLCNSLHTGSRCQSVILASSKTVFTIEPPISFPDPIYNGVTYINGPFGNNVGAEFNGNGRLNSSASYNPTQPLNGFSIGSWYRVDTGSSGWVLFKGTSTGFRNFGVYLYQLNQWWFSYTNGTEVKQLAFRGALTDGNWHYVQCIVSTTDVRMYVDGQPLTTIGGTTNTTFAFGPTGYPNEGPSTRGLNTGARLGTSVFSLTGDLSGTFLSSDKSLGQCEFAGAQNTFSQVCFNGGVCVNNAATGGFNCHCPPTWTGNLCEIPQICGSSPCFNGATCVASNLTSFTCSCVPGFYGDLCQTAATSCFPGLCLNGGTCNNIPGMFVCTCPTGFTGIICQTNIDDCASNPCLNGGVCVDGINSYTCSCSQLYIGARCETLALNSTLLIFTLEPYVSQIDPIYNGVTYTTGAYGSTNAVTSQGNGRLNGTASYNPPVPMNGFSIGSWLKLAPNQGGWILVKLNDGFRNFGVFVQAQKQIWFSYNEITGNKTQKNLAFVTTGAPFQDNNWHYVQCNVKLTSVSCFMDGANMVTNLGATSYPLPNYLTEGPVTRPLYTLARTSTGPNVFSLNGSLTGTFLSSMQSLPMCVYAGAKTNNVVCQNGGVCRDNLVTGGFACVCPLGLTGQLCETQLPLDVCVSNPCLNNGTCNTGVYTFTCTCPSGFTGTFCQTNINDCVVGLCLNGGVCVDGINSYRCACTVGFTGPSCQTRYLHCLPTSCSNGGTCIPGNSTTSFDFACVCASGFTGPTCASQTNECESSPCVHGTCSNRLGRYTCTCDSFYTGVNCESSLPKLNDTVFTLASNVSTVDPTYPGVAATTGPFSESGAFIFNGTGDLISNPALSPSLPMNGFSIGSWIKTAFVPEGGNQPSGWILFKGQNGFRNFGLFLSPLRQLWFSYTNVTVIQVAFPCGNLTDGNWHYVQAVVTLTSVTMYVDGMQLRTLSGQYAYSFNYLTEGPANRPLNTGSRTGDNRFGLSGTLFGTFLSSLKDVGQCEYASAMTVNGQVCFNNGVCEDNNSTVGGFVCKCAPGFAGALCQISGVDVVNFIASGNADGSNAVVLASNVLSLTGSTSWFVLPVSNLPQPQPVMVPLTFSAWVLAASPGRPAWIFFKGISGSADGRFFGVFYTGTAVQWFAGNTPVITSSPVDLSLSSWTNIAVTVRSNTTRLFINGVLAGISTVPIPWGPTLELVLGTRMNNAGTGKSTDFAFVGSMQDTRIYTAINRPLCVAAASIRLCANGGTCTATVGGGYQCA